MTDNNNELHILKGPDRVRKSPSVIFGSNGVEGVLNVAKRLLDFFMTEVSLGQCKKIEFCQFEDDSITIKSYDQCIVLSDNCDERGKPHWYNQFCDFEVGPKFKSERSEPNPFFALCCSQYVSEFFKVEVVSGGCKKKLSFEKGYNIGGLSVENCNEVEQSYTKVWYKPDSEVFTEISVPPDKYIELLRSMTVLNPGLTCTYEDKQTGYSWIY